MKKIVGLLLILILFSVQVYAQDSIRVEVDGQNLEMDVEPFMENNRVLVPLRAIAERLSANVKWDPEMMVVTMIRDNKACIVTIGQYNAIIIDGEMPSIMELDVAPTILDGRTMIPLRFFADFFGCETKWVQDHLLVTISTNQ